MSRAGVIVKQGTGYRAFIPVPLPPEPAIRVEGELLHWLSKADRALGRLDGVTSNLPNPDLFVGMYVRQEAVLSSQIEGTQSTLEDVLAFEVEASGTNRPRDVEEVVNYVRAMRHGLARLTGEGEQAVLPLSLRLLREIHGELMRGVRGQNRNPGEFRSSQNWIGPEGSTLATATFVPPPVPEMHTALGDLEMFLHERTLPDLVVCGLAHAQFETIHPFLDGNGRVGRLLVTFLLCEREVLGQPLLYLSHYLKRHRLEYYDRLTAIRQDGDWEGWLRFFLRGVFEVSQEATRTARAVLALHEAHRAQVLKLPGKGNAELLDLLFWQPFVPVAFVAKRLGVSIPAASRTVERFQGLGLLREVTGFSRNRLYRYDPYLVLFEPPVPPVLREDAPDAERTQAAP